MPVNPFPGEVLFPSFSQRNQQQQGREAQDDSDNGPRPVAPAGGRLSGMAGDEEAVARNVICDADIAVGLVEVLTLAQDIAEEGFSRRLSRDALGNEVEFPRRRGGEEILFDGSREPLFRIIKVLVRSQGSVCIQVDRKGQQAVLDGVGSGIKGIGEIVKTDAEPVILDGGGNAGIAENGRPAQLVLFRIEPGGKSLGGAAGIRAGIGVDGRAVPGAEQIAPGPELARDPYFSCIVRRDAPPEQFFPEGIGGADNRDNRIAAHGERNGAPLLLLFVQLAREHGEIGHPVQDIGHPFPGPAGRNVNADAGMRGLESLFPFHSQGEERKGSGNRHLSGDILNFPLFLCAGAGDGGKEQENSQGKGRF